MKAIVCEMCGSNSLLKKDGVYTCQSCGTMYSVEEAKKLIVEAKIEVSGTVSIDRSDELMHKMVLARQAFIDRRFSQAHEYSAEALRIDSGLPEMITIEVLSLIGEDDDLNDSTLRGCINTRTRMSKGVNEFTGSFQEKKHLLNTLNRYVRIVQDYKNDEYKERIRTLDSQKQRLYSEVSAMSRVDRAQSAAERQAALYELDQVRRANAEIEANNRRIDSEIRTIRSNVSKLEDALAKYKASITSLLHKTHKEEREEHENKKNAYWNEHVEEKARLDSELKEAQDSLAEICKSIQDKQDEIDEIEKLINEAPSLKKKESIQTQISKLEDERSGLSLLQGIRKQQISQEIKALFKQIPSIEVIELECKEIKEKKGSKLKSLRDELRVLVERKADIEKQISNIYAKLNLREPLSE